MKPNVPQSYQDIGEATRFTSPNREKGDLLRYISNLESELSQLRASKSQNMTNVTMNELMSENRYLKSQLEASQTRVPDNLTY